jgi:hypothetical protein
MGALFGGIVAWEAVTDRTSTGSLHSAVVTSSGVLGITAIKHSSKAAGHNDWRLVLLDPVTGQRKARRILGSGEPTCDETQAGFLWCRTKTEVNLLTLPSLDDKATWRDLRRTIRGLEAGITSARLMRSGTSIVVTANDGLDWALQADPLGGAPVTGRAIEEVRRPTPPERSVTLRSGTLMLKDTEGSLRAAVMLRSEDTPQELRATSCKDTYLGASFAHPETPAVSSGRNTDVEDVAFVLHKSSRSRDAHILVSRLGPESCPLWTADLGSGAVELTSHTGGVFAVIGSFPRGEGVSIGLDDATGKERWRSPF